MVFNSKIYNNVVSGASWCKKCVILMHDIKSNTANELDNILKTLTAKPNSSLNSVSNLKVKNKIIKN